jgi:zinc protease
MKKNIFMGLCSLVFCTLISAQGDNSKFHKIKELGGIEEYLFEPNGMNILLLQDNASPVVTVQIVYRVGSKHEVPGNTGSTHLLEHLMFKGTTTFNKKNGNDITNYLENTGAQLNATTWYDRTNYFETLPSDKIELALQMEADRMRNSLLLKEDKEAEMTVVRNEFERDENDPNSLLDKEIWSVAYIAHPYHHSTIGWLSDIEKAPIEVLHDFYNTYYWPDNATLTIIGDYNKDNVFELIEKYFGKITKAPNVIPQPYTEEPVQYGARKIVVKKPGELGVINKAYKIPGALHEDLPALTILGQIMGSGPSAILNKTFVDSGMGNYTYASATNFKEVGLFTIGVGFPTKSKHEDIDAKISEVISKIQKDGVTQEEVNRVVAKISAQTILSRDGSGSIAGQLTEAIAGGDWTDYIKGAERLTKVTAEDVKRVSNAYLNEDQSTTGYFVPLISGSNQQIDSQPVQYTSNEGKYFYRTPGIEYKNSLVNSDAEVSDTAIKEIVSAYETLEVSVKGEKFERKQVAGIDVITAKTGAKDFLTVSASFPIGSYLNTNGNETVPSLTTQMLSKGTTKNDKFKFSEKLEKLGVSIRVSASTHKVNIGFKCLKKDINTVIALLSEELRNPLFDNKEFELLKDQNINNLKQGLLDPGTQGSIALSQALYPAGHPNYETSIEETIENIEAVTIEDLNAFHKTYFGPAGMHLVAVGDIDTKELYSSITNSFKGWKGGITTKTTFKEPGKAKAITKVVTIPQKPSANLYIGQYTGIERKDKDFIPFYIGTNILGGGFSGRLMQTVRDRDGLTYGIFASHSGHTNTGGYWKIDATFNPSLFQKGLDATMVEVKNWVNNGVTENDLAANKTNITGSFKVGLATTSGLAGTLLSFVERGLEPNYVDQYPKDIEAVTLDQVNAVIKKYIDLNKLIIIKSGSLNDNGEPLK